MCIDFFVFITLLGLTADGRSNSPVSMFENQTNSHGLFENNWYVTRHPVVINPLAQLRQPLYVQNVSGTPQRQPSGKIRKNFRCFGYTKTKKKCRCL